MYNQADGIPDEVYEELDPGSKIPAKIIDDLRTPCSLSSMSIEDVESVIYSAMMSMNKHAETLVQVLNEHKSAEAAEAYRSGVYAVSMRLMMLIGSDGIERQKVRHDKIQVDIDDRQWRRVDRFQKNGLGTII